MNSSRRLAAIMFTDIVGYTSMMARDEKLAIAVVSNHKTTMQKLVPEYHGELIQFYGDGCLSVYHSVVLAMECAIQIQTALRKCEPEVPLRVGIHVGEILVKDNSVYGDGVNLASRIESLGQPGTIFFSEEVHLKISNLDRFKTRLLGSFEFKNVDRPMNIYALANRGFPVPDKSTLKGKLKASASKGSSGEPAEVKSIAVLPFETFSPNHEISFITNGIADEIRSQLSSINNLKVISRSSCMRYADNSFSLEKVRDELNVEFVLEGRVQAIANQVKVNVELNETKSSKQLWSLSSRNQTLDDVFELQIEIARQVVKELEVLLTDQEQNHLVKAPTHNREAFMHYQQGQELLHRGGGKMEELAQAADCFNTAIALDPNFSRAYIGLSDTYLEYIFWGRRPPVEVLDKAQKATLKALELDDTKGEFYGALGAIYFFQMKKGQAKRFLKKAVEISPNYLDAHEKLAWITIHDGNTEEALSLFTKARSLDPLSTKYMGDTGHAYYYAHRFDEGIALLTEFLDKVPGDPWLLWMKGYLYSGLGEYRKAIDTYLERSTGKNTNWMLAYNYGRNGMRKQAEDILEKHLEKRKTQHVPGYMIATIYAGIDNYRKALQWLEIDYRDGGQGLFFWGLKTDPKFVQLKSEQGFQALLNKIN